MVVEGIFEPLDSFGSITTSCSHHVKKHLCHLFVNTVSHQFVRLMFSFLCPALKLKYGSLILDQPTLTE